MVAPAPPDIPATLLHLLAKVNANARFGYRALASATPLLLITCLQVQWIQRVAHSLAQRRGRISSIISKFGDRKSTRLNSSHANISYAVFCLKKKKKKK